MAISYASNAILSKARAMFGKRLKKEDYDNLLGCGTVSEVLVYLKGHTKYAPLLNNLNENDVHRSQLEFILRQQLFYDLASLCRYEISVGADFSHYIIKRTEIEQIMRFLMLLSTGRPNEYLYSLPLYFSKVSSIKLSEFAKCKTYDDFLHTLGHSAYYKILEPFNNKSGGSLNLAEIEYTLYNYLYSQIYEIVEKHAGGDEKKSLLALLNTNIDLRNFVRIIRLKKYFTYTPEMIKKQLLPFGALRESQIDAMCNAESSAQIFSIMQSTIPGRVISQLEYSYTGEITNRGNYNISRKGIRFSTHPSVVLLSYINLAEIELSNIIIIIEGVRYQADKDRIKSAIIYRQGD